MEVDGMLNQWLRDRLIIREKAKFIEIFEMKIERQRKGEEKVGEYVGIGRILPWRNGEPLRQTWPFPCAKHVDQPRALLSAPS
jgi:hypothetical protein